MVTLQMMLMWRGKKRALLAELLSNLEMMIYIL